jgi:hypothetical protein
MCSIKPAKQKIHRWGNSGSDRTGPVVNPVVKGASGALNPRQVVAQFAQAQSPTAPVPPQNLEVEESVLGAMMLSPGAIGAVSEIADTELKFKRCE